MSFGARAARNVSGQAAGLALSLLDRILLTAVLIRAWGADIFSDWATLMASTALLMLAEFGFQVLFGNMLVRAENHGKSRVFQRLVGIGVFFYLTLGAAVVSGAAAILWFSDVSTLLQLQAVENAELLFAFLIGHHVLRLMRSGVAQIFRGKGEVYQLLWADVRAMSSAVLLGGAAAIAGAGPLTVGLIYLVAEALFGETWIVLLVKRRFPGISVRPRMPSRAEIRYLGKHLPWYGWVTSATILMLHTPVLILAWLGLGGPMLIAFVVQRTLVNFGKTVASTFSIAVGIELADYTAHRNAQDAQDGVRLLARFNSALAALLTSGLLFFGEPIVAVWTGRPGLGSNLILLWLLIPVIASAPAVPLQMLTIYRGRPKPQAAAGLAQIAVGLPASALAGMSWGVTGVAFGVALGELVGMGILLPLLASKSAGLRYLPLLGHSMRFFAGAVLWGGLIAWGVNELLPPASAVALAAGLVLWGALAALPIIYLSIPAALRKRLLAFRHKLRYIPRRTFRH